MTHEQLELIVRWILDSPLEAEREGKLRELRRRVPVLAEADPLQVEMLLCEEVYL